LFVSSGQEDDVMPAFDIAELQRGGFAVVPLPNEVGRIIDPTTLPRTIASQLQDDGVDITQPVRMVGGLTKSPAGGPGRYVILFVQA
jgi:hypothetical protein